MCFFLQLYNIAKNKIDSLLKGWKSKNSPCVCYSGQDCHNYSLRLPLMSAKRLASLSRRRTRKKKKRQFSFHVGSQSLASWSIYRGTLKFFSLPTKPLMARHHHIFKSLQYPIIQVDLCAPRMQSDLWSLESRLTRDFPKHPQVLCPLLYFSFCSQSMFNHQNRILTWYFADSLGSIFRHAAVVLRIIVPLAVWELVLLCLTNPLVIYPTSIFLYSSTELLKVR